MGGAQDFARKNEGEALREISVNSFEPIYVEGQGLFVVYDTLVPHQLFLTSIPRWCGTSASPESLRDSALGVRLAEHPPGVGESLPYNPQCPRRNPGVFRRS